MRRFYFRLPGGLEKTRHVDRKVPGNLHVSTWLHFLAVWRDAPFSSPKLRSVL